VKVLGIETSCDETAAATVEEGIVRSSVISSQIPWHAPYGGVVPELASRRHVESILPVIQQALSDASWDLSDIEGIAVTQGPGLVGSLLVGVETAKGMALALDLPLVGVNHVEAHLYAALIERPDLKFPVLGLIVSGGHTELVRWEAPQEGGISEVIGRTRDDAAGEAFDKVGKLMGLPYPGGPGVEALAEGAERASGATGTRSSAEGAERAGMKFPVAVMKNGSLDFSFSGIKTSVGLVLSGGTTRSSGTPLAEVAKAFQDAVVLALVETTMRAVEGRLRRQKDEARGRAFKSVVLTGGVACNKLLRTRLTSACLARGLECVIPSPCWCTDNAAMIALVGWYRLKDLVGRGEWGSEREGWGKSVTVDPNLLLSNA